MKKKILKVFQEKGLVLFIYIILAIIIGTTVTGYFARDMYQKNVKMRNQIVEVNRRLALMNQYVSQVDLGLRGYMITNDEKLLTPFYHGYTSYSENFKRMGVLLDSLGFDVSLMVPAEKSAGDYIRLVASMVNMVKNGDIDSANEIMDKDRGSDAYLVYSAFESQAVSYLNELKQENAKAYSEMSFKLLLSQIILFLFGIPILIIAVSILGKSRGNRKRLFKRLEESNDQYVYNDGETIDAENEEKIIEQMIGNLKKVAAFVKEIAKGNYDKKWEGMRDEDKAHNKETIAGELLNMRDQMKQMKQQDEKRIWETEGLANFAGIVRKHQHDVKTLSGHIVTELVKYLKAQVGAMFVVNEENEGEVFLELKATYAYDRLKFIEKKLMPGQGMAGQCYQEGKYVYMRNVPDEFITIKSALGDTPPTSILIVPLKVNDEIAGVIELASLNEFSQEEIDFLHKLGETIASAINSVQTNEQTRSLLEKSQQQAEEMRAQEEEMRQNMEELQATQEQMERKNTEVEDLLQQASENEERLKIQLEAIEELQQDQEEANAEMQMNAEGDKKMMIDILNEIPVKVYLKDADGKMFLANQPVADAHGLSLDELIGKSDFDFVDEKTAQEWRDQELKIMEKGEERYVFEETLGDKTIVLDSLKKVIYIQSLKQNGLLGIQQDITELHDLRKKVKQNKK